MEPERSKQLHNFSLPCLKWGKQRFLRCVKEGPSDAGEPEPSSSLDRRSSRLRFKLNQSQQNNKQINNPRSSSSSPTQTPLFQNSKRKSPNTQRDSENNNIDAVREKLTTDLKVAAKKLKVSLLEEGGGGNAAGGPWNLRTRRAACKAPHEDEGKCDLRSSPVKNGEAVVSKENSTMLEKNERVKFSVPISKKDIEQDYLVLFGVKPPRRPTKRPRIVQKKLDVRLEYCFVSQFVNLVFPYTLFSEAGIMEKF